MNERTIGVLCEIRSYINNSRLRLPEVLGLREGFVARESTLAHLRERLSNGKFVESQYCRQIEEILTTSEALPHPFWFGIHPTIMDELLNNLNNPDSEYWQTAIRPTPLPVNFIPQITIELGVNRNTTGDQAEFLSNILPSGSLSYIFSTRGNESFWRKVPIASAFVTDSHQMSLPAIMEKQIRGFNMVLLTETDSKSTPKLWGEDKDFSKKDWMNIHQAAHCLTIPTCWEYIDRTYSLLTPGELLELTVVRNRSLLRWNMSYGMDIETSCGDFQPMATQLYPPDSTSYLYEIKVIQKANFLAKNRRVKRSSSLPEELYWFRGFHLDQVCEELGYNKQEIIGALSEMDAYWINNHHTPPKDPILNSAVHSTDIGTHPSEEVCIDVLALTIAGKLPQRLSYWGDWTSKVFDAWRKWIQANDPKN